MKILHIVEVLHVDGRTTILRELIQHMDPTHEHFVLVLKWPGPRADSFSELKTPIYALHLDSPTRNLKQKLHALRNVRSFNPDICICWCGAGNLTSIVPRMLGIPVIWTLHTSVTTWPTFSSRSGGKVLSVLSHIVPSKIICCSTATRNVYRDTHKFAASKLTVVNNGIDCSRYTKSKRTKEEIRASLDISPDELVIISAARMPDPNENIRGQYKDLGTLITAAGLLKRNGIAFRLLLVGINMDEHNEVLRGGIEAECVQDQIFPLGVRSDLTDLFLMADAFAMSSVSGEGLPMALIEAMAAGAIPVGSDSGSIHEVIDNVGYIVPQMDAEAFCRALMEIAALTPEELTKRQQKVNEHTIENFGIDRVVDAYTSELLKAL